MADTFDDLQAQRQLCFEERRPGQGNAARHDEEAAEAVQTVHEGGGRRTEGVVAKVELERMLAMGNSIRCSYPRIIEGSAASQHRPIQAATCTTAVHTASATGTAGCGDKRSVVQR